jgi:hypothetical protein
MPLNFDDYNSQVKDWAQTVKRSMQSTGAGMGIQHVSRSPSTGASLQKIRPGFKYGAGAIEIVSFKFPRSLVWTHKGAGKGMGGPSGSTWVDKLGNTKRTNTNSKGKMGTGNRHAKQWFTQPLDAPDGINNLADLVAIHLGATISENILKPMQ